MLQGGLASTRVLELRRDNLLSGSFDPGFRIRLHLKDLKNALELARVLDIEKSGGGVRIGPVHYNTLEEIDILIDSAPGGATASLPNRRAAFQPWDAWDYAIIMDGWYKAVVSSNSQNTPSAWSGTARKTDRDIILV